MLMQIGFKKGARTVFAVAVMSVLLQTSSSCIYCEGIGDEGRRR